MVAVVDSSFFSFSIFSPDFHLIDPTAAAFCFAVNFSFFFCMLHRFSFFRSIIVDRQDIVFLCFFSNFFSYFFIFNVIIMRLVLFAGFELFSRTAEAFCTQRRLFFFLPSLQVSASEVSLLNTCCGNV